MKNILQKSHIAFTLAEVMLVVVLLSTISAIAIPTIITSRPSTEKVLLKKAYNTTEQIVSELAGNERFYPNIPLKDVNAAFAGNTSPSGFFNYSYPPNDDNLEFTIVNGFNGVAQNNNTITNCNCYNKTHNKLSMLFCCSLKTVNKKGGTVCTTTSNSTTCNYSTQDGIDWNTVDTTQTNTDLTKPIFTITVNVDNRWGGNHKNITSGNKKTVFNFYVYYDGKIKVDADAQNVLADALHNKRVSN